MNEGLDDGDFGTRGIVAGCTVAKRNCSVTVEAPGRVGSRRVGDGVGGNTDNIEVGVLVTCAHRSEEFLYVVHSVVWVAPGAHQDSLEAGNVSRGRLGDLVEAEASFGLHGTICGHPHLGGAAGGGDHEVVAHEVQLVFLSGLLYVDLHVVPVVDLLLNVLIYL